VSGDESGSSTGAGSKISGGGGTGAAEDGAGGCGDNGGQNNIPAQVEENRKHVSEAAIMRIMKSRKTLSHNDLIAEVFRQVSTRFSPNATVRRLKSSLFFLYSCKVILKCVSFLIATIFLFPSSLKNESRALSRESTSKEIHQIETHTIMSLNFIARLLRFIYFEYE